MRLTRRGWALVAVVVLSVAMGAWFGERALNAIVAPSVVALLLAAAQVYRADAPGVDRIVPAPGHPGEERTVRLDVDADGTAVVTEALGDGLSPDRIERSVLDGDSIEYAVRLERRGPQRLGPATVTSRDVFGLVTGTDETGLVDELLVYPRVVQFVNPGPFAGLVDRAGSPDRDAFESLREYVSGDSLRDVHWKSSAKRDGDDLVVMEFATQDEGGVTIAAEATHDPAGENADEMAAAAASVLAYLHDHGIEVELVAPNGQLDGGIGDRHRQDAFELLARTPAGTVPPDAADRADIRITADGGEAAVEVLGQRVPFDRLTDYPDIHPETAPEVPA